VLTTVAGRAPAATSAASSCGSVERQHTLGRQQLTEADVAGEGAARTDADEHPGAQSDQLLAHDRSARAAQPGGLDRQRLAVPSHAGVPPEPARVVEHLGRLEQDLRDGERTMRVTGHEHALRELGGRAEVVGTDGVLQWHAAVA